MPRSVSGQPSDALAASAAVIPGTISQRMPAAFADGHRFGASRQGDDGRIHERAVEDDVGGLEDSECAQRQQIHGAGPRPTR